MNVKNRACIRTLSFRSLRASRRRNLIAITAIALTALLFTSLFTIAMSVNSSFEEYTFRQIGGYSHGTFKEVTDEQIERLSAHPNVKAVGRRTVIGAQSDGVFAKEPAEISFMDENCTKWSYAEPSVGHQPQEIHEITMDTRALQLLHIEPTIGAEVRLTYTVGDGSRISYEKTDTFTLAGWWEYDTISPVHYINISEAYAKDISAEALEKGCDPFRTDLNVMMSSAIDIRGQMEQTDQALGYSWDPADSGEVVRIGVNWGYTTAQLGESMDASTLISILAFLALVIFTGYLIIYNIFQISVTDDIRFYGLLKTIGVTPRQLRRIVRQQAALLCLIGIPIGLLAGYGIGAVLTPVIMASTSIGTTVSAVSVSPFIFLASALFALATVFLSCARPARLAAKVSPIEAVRYTDVTKNKNAKNKHRRTRGAKVYQMAFSNLGRNKQKTILVVTSLALSVVLLNLLVTFTGGFDMEKYLEMQTCADFIVGSADYFQYSGSENGISAEQIAEIRENTTASLSGCGYTTTGCDPDCWMTEESWLADTLQVMSEDAAKLELAQQDRRGDLVRQSAQIEGFDPALFEKLTVISGDLSPLFTEQSNAIAIAVDTDDYGNVNHLDLYPPIGSTQTITYIDEDAFIDSRTGMPCDDNTPEEYVEYQILASHDVDYTVCAYVTVPYAISYRYYRLGYRYVLPVEKLAHDSRQECVPMFYMFDTADANDEAAAEKYLADRTSDELSDLMYESKSTLRDDFLSFRHMFLLLGSLLCAIIGLVGILNFFNAMMTGILSRKREFAVLQAVGMTKRQLKNMLVCEGLFYALSSAVLALLLSLVFHPSISKLLEQMFWFFRAGSTILPVLLAIPVFALIGWLIPAVMYDRAARHSIVEQLRDDV